MQWGKPIREEVRLVVEFARNAADELGARQTKFILGLGVIAVVFLAAGIVLVEQLYPGLGNRSQLRTVRAGMFLCSAGAVLLQAFLRAVVDPAMERGRIERKLKQRRNRTAANGEN